MNLPPSASAVCNASGLPAVALPNDLATCQRVIQQLQATTAQLHEALEQAQRRNRQLEHRLELLLKARFGPRADRLNPGQLLLFAEEVLAKAEAAAPAASTATRLPRRSGCGTGRPVSSSPPRSAGRSTKTGPARWIGWREAIALGVRCPPPEHVSWPPTVQISAQRPRAANRTRPASGGPFDPALACGVRIGALKVNPKNPAYWQVLALALDAVAACDGQMSKAAARLGITTSSLTKFLADHPKAWTETRSACAKPPAGRAVEALVYQPAGCLAGASRHNSNVPPRRAGGE